MSFGIPGPFGRDFFSIYFILEEIRNSWRDHQIPEKSFTSAVQHQHTAYVKACVCRSAVQYFTVLCVARNIHVNVFECICTQMQLYMS